MTAVVFSFFGTNRKEAQERLLSFVSSFQPLLPDTLVVPMMQKEADKTKEELLEMGIDDIRLVSLVMEDGKTHQRNLAIAEEWKKVFGSVSVTTPILENQKALLHLSRRFGKNELLVLHGQEGKFSKAAEALRGDYGLNVCVLNGYPEIEEFIDILAEDPVVVPLMFTLGHHVEKDILGEEESIFSRLKAKGHTPTLSSWSILEEEWLKVILLDSIKRA